MNQSRMKWAAVATFAAVMTVAEVIAIQAAARDARRWLASDTAREIQTAGQAVAAVVAGDRSEAARLCEAGSGECAVIRIKGRNAEEVRAAIAEARSKLREARRVREVKWSWSNDES